MISGTFLSTCSSNSSTLSMSVPAQTFYQEKVPFWLNLSTANNEALKALQKDKQKIRLKMKLEKKDGFGDNWTSRPTGKYEINGCQFGTTLDGLNWFKDHAIDFKMNYPAEMYLPNLLYLNELATNKFFKLICLYFFLLFFFLRSLVIVCQGQNIREKKRFYIFIKQPVRPRVRPFWKSIVKLI